MGMRGFGRVYRMFVEEEDFQDDEVALLHDPNPPYRAVSEPLVHYRAALAHWTREGWLTSDDQAQIVERLKALWYADRTKKLFADLVFAIAAPQAATEIENRLSDFDEYRIKTHDLVHFLQQAPWRKPDSENERLPGS